jgi:hypothetical protein
MLARIILIFTLLSVTVYGFAGCTGVADTDCPGCQQLTDALQSNMFLVVDTDDHKITAVLYYENRSSPDPRTPINFSTVIVHVYDDLGEKETSRIFTDKEGEATFDFSAYKDESVNFKFLYCPMTCPDSYSDCVFIKCLEFGGIECSLPTCDISDITPVQTAPVPLNCPNVFPAIQSASYTPPPPPLSLTPPICFPLLLIFALLGGSLFLSGQNPFAGFDFSAPRIGRHIRYQARGRGFSMDFLTIARSIKGLSGALKQRAMAKKKAKELKDKGGSPEDVQAAIDAGKEKPRYFGVTDIKEIKEGSKGGFVMDAKGRVTMGAGRKGLKGAMKDASKRARTLKAMPYTKALRAQFASLASATAGVFVDRTFGELLSYFGVTLDTGSAFGKFLGASIKPMELSDAALKRAKKSGWKGAEIEGKGVQAVDGGNIQTTTKSKDGETVTVTMNAAELREGELTGTIVKGDVLFKIEDGQITSVELKPVLVKGELEGVEISGSLRDKHVKALGLDGVKQNLGQKITLKTTTYSKQFKKDVIVVTNPLSEKAGYQVIIPGTQGEKNGVSLNMNADNQITKIKDLAKPKEPTVDVPGYEHLGVNSKIGENLKANAQEGNEAINNRITAMHQVAAKQTRITGEQHAQANPELRSKIVTYGKVAKAKVKQIKLSQDAHKIVTGQLNHQQFEQTATQRAESAGYNAGADALAKNKTSKQEWKRAEKQFNDAITPSKTVEGPPESPDLARKRYLDPVIAKHKKIYEAPYMDNFVKTYKASLGDQYAKQSTDPSVQRELRRNGYKIASAYIDPRVKLKASRPDIAKQIDNVPVTSLTDKRNNTDKISQNDVIGSAARQAVQDYKATRENPYYSQKDLLRASQPTRTTHENYDNPMKISGDPSKAYSSEKDRLYNLKTVLNNVGKLGKAQRNNILNTALIDPYKAAKMASDAAKKLAKKPKKK